MYEAYAVPVAQLVFTECSILWREIIPETEQRPMI